MRRYLPIFFLIISCTSEIKTESTELIEPLDCANEISSILNETNFMNFKDEISEISEWNPNWLPNYVDSVETNYGLFLELKADTTFHILIDCGYTNDKLCRHTIYSIPQLNNYDYINYFEEVNCNVSFLSECGFDLHQHSYEVHSSKSYSLGSSYVHGMWKLDSSSVENPVFNYLSIGETINGIIKSQNTASGFKLIDLQYNQKGTALNHEDSSEFILHCLIATGNKLVLEDRLVPLVPKYYFFSER